MYINDETGRPAFYSKILLKVVLLAYAREITGSRSIEHAGREIVLFMALSISEQPDHLTIAAFVAELRGPVK